MRILGLCDSRGHTHACMWVRGKFASHTRAHLVWILACHEACVGKRHPYACYFCHVVRPRHRCVGQFPSVFSPHELGFGRGGDGSVSLASWPIAGPVPDACFSSPIPFHVCVLFPLVFGGSRPTLFTTSTHARVSCLPLWLAFVRFSLVGLCNGTGGGVRHDVLEGGNVVAKRTGVRRGTHPRSESNEAGSVRLGVSWRWRVRRWRGKTPSERCTACFPKRRRWK